MKDIVDDILRRAKKLPSEHRSVESEARLEALSNLVSDHQSRSAAVVALSTKVSSADDSPLSPFLITTSTLFVELTDDPGSDLVVADSIAYYDVDPFVAMTGSITNLSETETLSAFVPFEQGFLAPLGLDTPLARQALIAAHIEDTNDDGSASLSSTKIEFSILATEDPTDPTTGNTHSIGFTEALGIGRLPPLDRLVRRVGQVEPIDQTFIDRVSPDASFSHLLGQVILEDISPGDTATFRAIISLGDPNDPSLPLLDVENLEAILVATELIAANSVPEPSSAGLFACCALYAALLGRRRARKRNV